MKLLLVTLLVAAAAGSVLPGYQLPTPSHRLDLRGQSTSTGAFHTGTIHGQSSELAFGTGALPSGLGSVSVGAVDDECPEGQMLQYDGTCVTPIVRRNMFVYRTPLVAPIMGPRPDVVPPRIEHNMVFIHTPEGGAFDIDPVVVPPPQQKNVIYVLNKRPTIDPSVLEFPPPEQVAPEIFFVNYADGENPELPGGGGNLQTALSQAAESNGEIIGHTDAIVDIGARATGVSEVGVGVGVGDVGQSATAGIPSTLYRTP